jgi:hypothetical protein
MAVHRVELGEHLEQIDDEERARKKGGDPFAQN